MWHTEAMVSAFSWWCEGKSPWALKAPTSDDSYSSRVFQWTVACWAKKNTQDLLFASSQNQSQVLKSGPLNI